MSKTKSFPVALVFGAINLIVVLGVLGLLVYTRVVFKRPVITEQSERGRLAALHAKPLPAPVPGLITFDPVTVNIRSTPGHPKPADGTPQQLQGKLHFVTLGFAVEMQDMNNRELIEGLRPVIMDRLLSILGRKDFTELTTVQGRYLLRSELIDLINQLLSRAKGANGQSKTLPVTNTYFTEFLVQ